MQWFCFVLLFREVLAHSHYSSQRQSATALWMRQRQHFLYPKYIQWKPNWLCFRMAPVKDEDDDRGRGGCNKRFASQFLLKILFCHLGLPLNVVTAIRTEYCESLVSAFYETIRCNFFFHFSFFLPNIVSNIDYSQMTLPLWRLAMTSISTTTYLMSIPVRRKCQKCWGKH